MSETYVIAPDGTPERLIQRLENATPGELFYCEADREEAVEIAQEEFATAIAEVEARGRRQGLEEAAKWHDEWQVRNRDTGVQSRARLHGRYAASIRSLATDPTETQKPETGESAVTVCFQMSFSSEGHLRVSGMEPRGLILSSADHDALLADIGPAIKELLQHVGKWHPDSNNGASK